MQLLTRLLNGLAIPGDQGVHRLVNSAKLFLLCGV
jgi:hypothetical protein